MQIDMFTVLVQGGLSVLLLGAIFLFYWTRDTRSVWLIWWSAPFFMGAVSFFAFTQWREEPNFLPIALGNVTLFLAFGGIWQAARAFERRRPVLWPLLVATLGWLALCSWPFFMSSLSMRVIIASIVATAFLGLAAYEFWRGRAEQLASRAPAIALLVLAALVFAVRIPLIGGVAVSLRRTAAGAPGAVDS